MKGEAFRKNISPTVTGEAEERLSSGEAIEKQKERRSLLEIEIEKLKK